MFLIPATIIFRKADPNSLRDPCGNRQNRNRAENFRPQPEGSRSPHAGSPRRRARGNSTCGSRGDRYQSINLKSPRRTLMACGSVSIRVRRRNWCTRVTPRVRFATVRNANVWMHRPLRQMRTRRLSTGPRLSALMASAIVAINGRKNAITRHARRTSKMRQLRVLPMFRMAVILSPMATGLSREQSGNKCLRLG